ncbi:alpha/beta hydrolase [Subtercola sp. YIM 133946]|uniref:alpha/beta hydrolase n=1 Tax=Subtercola sp. YIM 133946 TaxID=3118909 RepID=UPI002F9530C8
MMSEASRERIRTPEGWRAAAAMYDSYRNETSVPLPGIASYHPAVELRPGLTAAIAVPEGEGPFPVFVITHGPGLTAGSSHLYRRLTMDVAGNGYLAITPDFRLAPEHPFPAGYDDMRFALGWARDRAAEWGGDGARIVLWGDALGASLALGLVLGMRDEPDAPALKAFVGVEGVYDFTSPMLANGSSIKWYPGDGGESVLRDKRVSPLLHIEKGMQLPHLLLITGNANYGVPGTLDLVRKLQDSDLPFELHALPGMPHDFMTFPELDGMRHGHRLLFESLARTV